MHELGPVRSAVARILRVTAGANSAGTLSCEVSLSMIWRWVYVTDMAINTRSDSEHQYVCPWVWMLRIVHYLRSRTDEEQAKILGGGVAPPLRE